MNNIILGRYISGNSWIHRLDPRAKLVSVIYFIGILFFANNIATLLLLWAFTFVVMYLTKVKIRIFLRGVRPLIWLILFTVCLQIFFTAGGQLYVEWGPFKISSFGLQQGVYIFSRFVMIVFISTVVTLTTKPIDLTDGIHFLMKPFKYFKIPIDEFIMMLSISLRFIPNLLDETQKVIDAQRSRGVIFGEGSLIKQMKKLIPLFLPLFVNSLNRAEELANVMEVRGYHSEKPRSSYRQLHWKFQDSACILIMILMTLIFVYTKINL